ncbi:MAG: PP2C family protein-serine/threonine phosphatase [Planctomycetota bacterium]
MTGASSTARYRVVDPDPSNSGVETIVAALREMSSQTEPQAMLAAYGRHMLAYRPSEFLVSISLRGLPKGRYKVTRAFEPATLTRDEWDRFDPWANWNRLREGEGGLIGEMIATPTPKLLHDLSIDDDPVLGDALRGMGSMVAVPAFDGGEPLNWNFQFRRDPRGYSPRELEEIVLQGNLLGTATRNLVSLRREADLRGQLQGQFEQIAGIQRALLPRSAPKIPGLRIASSYLTSEHAGGDYYDFFELSEGKWGVVIADVSGHGAAAATIMAILHTLLHGEAHDADPTRIMSYANRRLMQAGIEGHFVTVFYGVYEPETGRLHYARCGHNPPRLYSTGCESCIIPIEEAGALPLGVLDDIEIDSADVVLEPGQSLVLYTDGITEAFSPDREEFGVERLDDAIRQASGDPDGVIESVYAGLFGHVGAMTRDDDQTLVVLRREEP